MSSNSRPQSTRSKSATVIISVLSVLALGGFVWFTHWMLSHKSEKPARTVQTIQVIRPPPPPPPDQPPPPPPPKPDEQIPQNEPDPTPDQSPAPSEQLALDADGGAGGDAFGLAAHRGGSDLVGTGGAAFAWYTTKIKDQVVEKLSGDVRLRTKKFTVGVRVWIEPDGSIKEARLSSTTGDRELDKNITEVLSRMQRLSESPPLEMPQPVSLKIVSQI